MSETEATPPAPPSPPAAPNPTPAPTGATPSNEPAAPAPSVLNEPDPAAAPVEAPAGAPETYADFTAPEGVTLDKETLAAAAPLFKELNLTQDQAQKLVTLQASREAELAGKGREAFEGLRTKWQGEVKTEFGSRLPEVRAEVGKALSLLPEAVSKDFRQAMDLYGVGDNPAFVRAMYGFAKLVNEGKAVAPGNPAPVAGAPGAKPASHAQAIYPTLTQ